MTEKNPRIVQNASLIFDSDQNGVTGEMQKEHEDRVESVMALGSNSWERGLIFAGLTQGFLVGTGSACQVFGSMHPELDGEDVNVAVPFTVAVPDEAEKIESARADILPWGIRLEYPDGPRVVFEFATREQAQARIESNRLAESRHFPDSRWVNAVPFDRRGPSFAADDANQSPDQP